MSILNKWSGETKRDFAAEAALDRVQTLQEPQLKELFFQALRAGSVEAVRNILSWRPQLLNDKLFGFEGSDVKSVIKGSTTGRCYTYTGVERDGYFYPLHAAAEGGNKILTMLLIQAGADRSLLDYRSNGADVVATGDALHAFLEMSGLTYASMEKYEGHLDREGQRSRQGTLYFKKPGYHEKLHVLYTGSWKDGLYHGNGTLYHEGSDVLCYVGRFKCGKRHGRGISFDRQGNKVYAGSFRDDLREGRGEEFDNSVEDEAIPTVTSVTSIARAIAEANNSGGSGGGSHGGSADAAAPKASDSVSSADASSGAASARPMRLVYKGEFAKGQRHGFGISYISDGYRYAGRFDQGAMSGLGVFVHPNGDRYEGMLAANRPDGPGSFYSISPVTGQEEAKHATWAAGRAMKDLPAAFVPKSVDLPEDPLADKMAEMLAADEVSGGPDGGLPGHGTSINDAFSNRAGVVNSSTNYVSKPSNPNDISSWKRKIANYLKLTTLEAVRFGLIPESELERERLQRQLDQDQDSDAGEEGRGDGALNDVPAEDVNSGYDEVAGYHFVDIPGLFVAYAYVGSAARVFEVRECTRELHKLPDFEQVYHLVIDAVDSYNEQWEDAYFKSLDESEAGAMASDGAAAVSSPGNTSSDVDPKVGRNRRASYLLSAASSSAFTPQHQGKDFNDGSLAGSTKKRLNYMTAAEIREETLQKQRRELALKQGLIHLEAEVEKMLGTKVINQLRRDLFRLIEESEITATDNAEGGGISRSASSDQVAGDAIPGPPPAHPSSPSSDHGSVKSGSAANRFSFGHGSVGGVSGALSATARNSFAAELLEIMDLAAAVL